MASENLEVKLEHEVKTSLHISPLSWFRFCVGLKNEIVSVKLCSLRLTLVKLMRAGGTHNQ